MTLLDALAGKAPKTHAEVVSTPRGDSVAWLDSFLRNNAGKLPAMGPWENYQGGRKLVFEICPFNPDHKNDSAFLIQRPDGTIQAGCHHNGCAKENWHSLRAMIAPRIAPPIVPAPRTVVPHIITEQSDPLASYIQMQSDAIAGKLDSLAFPWSRLTRASRALVPGTVTCLVGDAGCGKSLALMECMLYWNQCLYQPAIFELEDSKEFHLSRAQAQLCQEAGFTTPEWMKGEDIFNSDPDTMKRLRDDRHAYVRKATESHRVVLTEISDGIWASPDKQASLTDLALWVEERAKEGHQVIVVDPVSVAAQDDKPWVVDNAFLVRVKLIARKYNSRIVLSVHPKKGAKGGATLDDLAGGAAYGRLAHTVIWIEIYDKPEELLVRKNFKYPAELCIPNRIMKVVKCRNGPGRGSRIAFDFDSTSLTFRELGLVERQGL